MAIRGFPFAGPDRPWGADEWRQFMVHMRQPGIIADVDQEMLVEPVAETLQSVVRPGMAFIAGHQVVIDTDETVDHDTADLENPRVDLVVLTTDWTTAERSAYVEVLTGTPAASPAAPTPTQDDVAVTEGLWQEPLAEVTVAAAAGETGGHTDLRTFMEVPGRLLVVADETELAAIDPTFHRFAIVAPGTESGSVRWYDPDTASWETVIAGAFATEAYVDTAIDNATTGYTEGVVTLGTSGTQTLDFGVANVWRIDPTGAVNFAFSNLPATDKAAPGTLIVENDSQAITWPAGTNHPDGEAPALDGETWLSLVALDDGTVIVGAAWTGVA